MRITTVLGSPNKTGKTAKALGVAEKKLKLQKHEITRINTSEYEINGCLGCYSCTKSKDMPNCATADSMSDIISKFISAEAIIISSPIYFFGITAQLKLLTDRLFCLSNTNLLDGKHIVGLIICRGNEEENSDLVKEFFRRTFDSREDSIFNTHLIGTYAIPYNNSDYFDERTELIISELVKKLNV